MPAIPEIKPLSRRDRRNTFILLLTVFCIAVPVFVFYAMGYRYDLSGDAPTILGTGGLYIAADADNSDLFLDEEEVRSPRIFRQATYIQGVTPGIHRVHVQATDLQTWVKELPVFSHIVTEGSSFNVPVRPQVRPIPEYISRQGEAVYPGLASTTLPFMDATTSIPLFATSSVPSVTRRLVPNAEYAYVESLFSATTSTSTNLVERVISEVNTAFRFGTVMTATTSSTATTTIRTEQRSLFRRGEEVFVHYHGDLSRIPYYYCVHTDSIDVMDIMYGAHVRERVQGVLSGEVPGFTVERNGMLQTCSTEIRIDRKWQTVHWFNFLPNSTDLVLMHLDDGLYVVEIDDRAWQNTQLLYPGADLSVVVDGRQIFVKDREYYAEVFTDLISI